jgi:hypothetical protein
MCKVTESFPKGSIILFFGRSDMPNKDFLKHIPKKNVKVPRLHVTGTCFIVLNTSF